MSRMVDDSASRARDYYQAYLQSEAEGQESHTVWYYKDYFAEENSNFFFKIVPEDTKKYPTLENYESKDYQFHEVLSQQTQLLEGSTSFSYKLSLPDIIKFWKENYVPDEYSYDDRAAYEEDADVFLRNYRSQVRYRICIGIGALFHLTILVLVMTMTVRIHIFIW